jgi:lipopolysaccharide/colanic/teichoic acid biosynthesis glycosyltransferase
MKLFLDFLILVMTLPIFFILFPIISLILLIFQGKPVFYTQSRVGKNGNLFKLIKFRTMINSNSQNIHEVHMKKISDNKVIKPSLTPSKPIRLENDDRITKIGGFLRKSSLDELPNILNVLIGQMSFIGPRPLVLYESELYGEYSVKRNTVRPGITGLAQIQGRLDLSLQERLYWDLKYVDNRSFIYDLKILLKTIKLVLSRRGAN